MTTPGEVHRTVTAWVVLPGHGNQRCVVDLEYCGDDPYAVSAVLYGAEPVRWTFARDLFDDALSGDAGLGDVRFRHTERGATDWVWMQLVGVEDQAWVRLPIRACAEFLSAVKLSVPVANDLPSPSCTLEVELAQLLEQG